MQSFIRLAQRRPLGSHATYTLLPRRPCQVQQLQQQQQQLQNMRRFTTTPTRRHADPRGEGPPTGTSTNTNTSTTPSPTPTAAATRPAAGGSTNFYRTHGRALFKALTLAFFSYQIIYWAWLTLETEEIKDQKNREIAALEDQVRLLDEARRTKTSSSS